MTRWTRGGLAFSLILFSACHTGNDDPAAQATAILRRQPADFTRQLIALDSLADAALGAADSLPSAWAESLSRQARRLQPALVAARSDSEKVNIVTNWIFDSLKITPLPDEQSLSASLPSRVFAARRGSCLGLSLVFLAFGQKLGLPLVPVFLPGHIFVRFRSAQYTRNVETLRRGMARTDSFYREVFSLRKRAWYSLRDAAPRQALGALVFNLGNAYWSRGDWKTAAKEFRLTEEIVPGYPEALGNQGAALLEAGHRHAAEKKFRAVLAGDSLAVPAWKNLALIYQAQGVPEKAAWAETRLAALKPKRNLQDTEALK